MEEIVDFILILFILNSRKRKEIHSELTNKIRNSLWIHVVDGGFIVNSQKMESQNNWIPEKIDLPEIRRDEKGSIKNSCVMLNSYSIKREDSWFIKKCVDENVFIANIRSIFEKNNSKSIG